VLQLRLGAALAGRDYTAALHALHAHFDYAQAGGVRGGLGAAAAAACKVLICVGFEIVNKMG
jgi:hypothetical protein